MIIQILRVPISNDAKLSLAEKGGHFGPYLRIEMPFSNSTYFHLRRKIAKAVAILLKGTLLLLPTKLWMVKKWGHFSTNKLERKLAGMVF